MGDSRILYLQRRKDLKLVSCTHFPSCFSNIYSHSITSCYFNLHCQFWQFLFLCKTPVKPGPFLCHINRAFTKLNVYCGSSCSYLILSEYQSHTEQGGRVNLPCAFVMVWKYSHILFHLLSWPFLSFFFWSGMQKRSCSSHNTPEQQCKVKELIYALFPLSHANWKASKALAIWCKW